MAAPVTNFALREKYKYLEGFGNYHSSEAVSGACFPVNNSPQKPPYGLRTERISGTSFTAPRHLTLQTWMYRITDSLDHGEFTPHETSPSNSPPSYLSPNSYMWPSLPTESGHDYVSAQTLLAGAGNPATKSGLAIHTFSITASMKPTTAFSSLDGDLLIIPQSGALDIRTELGYLLVRQNEICVIPRGIRHHVSLPNSSPCRGYICELFQSHFRLPTLGVVGSTGLANVRDFQIPVASFDGVIDSSSGTATPDKLANNFTIISRQNRTLWSCEQDHTPFDVVSWHGTLYPYKYDLARFCVLGNALFDEHDPSLYTVLTVPTGGDEGGSVCDFAIIPPRWQVAENTFWLPYFHRNTCSEFYGPIVNNQDSNYPMNGGTEFKPFVAGLNGSMVTHGAAEDEYRRAQNTPTKPTKLMTDGITLFLLETELPLMLSDYGKDAAIKNFKVKPKGANKL